jgi:hypothetical protein
MGSSKTDEKRVRRMAARQRMRLEKSRRRDPNAFDYNTYMLIDTDSNGAVLAPQVGGRGYTLNQIETFLKGGRS